MARPAVVIGLGGTGQWVLTYLKKDMQEAGSGELPANVKLLAFDTMPQAEVEVRTVGGIREEKVEVGSVRLSNEEFVHIGGDASKLGEAIANDGTEFAHIAKWFRAKEWRKILLPSAWILDEGAGRNRQLGRLAVFKDSLGRATGSLVWRSLRTAVEGVKSQVSEDRRLEIILAGSFAGGTGSGIFIDIALILRHLAKDIPHALRGYFVLPTAFSSDPTSEMLARSFAAWRELNRFMLINPDFPIRVHFAADDPHYQVLRDQRLFDACYLIDGYRLGNPLNVDPRHGVFPTVSEAISAILDDEAGTAYTRWILQNLNPVYVDNQGVPLYSAVGTYTFKVPAYYKQQEASHRFTMNLLEKLLQPDDIRARGGNRVRLLALPDQNLEKGRGRPGRHEVGAFLSTQRVSYKDEVARPTTFTYKVARIVEEQGAKNENLVEEHATAVLRPVRTRKQEDPSWLRPYTDLGEDPALQALRDEVEGEVSVNLVRQFGPRKGDSREHSLKRLEGIEDFVFRHYGGETADGTEVEGLFGETLRKCQDFHLSLFRRMIRLWVVRTLMGESTDPDVARTGKVGYVYDFFDGLVDALEQVRLFMQAVQAKREKEKPRLRLEGLAEAARKIAEARATEKMFWIIPHPAFERDLDNYLKAQQRLVDLRKEELLHSYVVSTSGAMKEIAIRSRDEVERWIWHLATGDDPAGIPGLYSGLASSLDAVEANHGVDRELSEDPANPDRPAIQKLVGEEPEPVDEAEIKRVLAALEWDAAFQGGKLILQAHFQPEAGGEEATQLYNPGEGTTEQERSFFGYRNRKSFLSISSRRFAGAGKRMHIAQKLVETYPEAQSVVEEIGGRAEPLVAVTARDPAKRSALIRVAYLQNGRAVKEYFDSPEGVQGELRAANKLSRTQYDDDYNISVVNSSNPYKCTIVQTDDCYRHVRFTAWSRCAEGFYNYVFEEGGQGRDPTLIHNFAAEANAARYEKALAHGDERRVLHPWVVMLLEEEERFRQCVYSILMGILRPVPTGENFIWKLRLPTRMGQQEIVLSEIGKAEGTIFQAMYNFVIKGRDIRKGYEHVRIFPARSQDPDLVQRAIDQKRGEWGRQGEAEHWQNLVDPGNLNTFLKWLRGNAEDEYGALVREELRDLADLVELILIERIKNLDPGWKPAREEQITPGELPYQIAGGPQEPREPGALVEAEAPPARETPGQDRSHVDEELPPSPYDTP